MGTRNTLGDLNNILFEGIERLSDREVKGEELVEEVERMKAISGVAKDIIVNANLVLQANKFQDDRMDANGKTPKMLEG